MSHIVIIGGGPAGLRAAEIASASGHTVSLYEQKRSVGRKFLVAGKGGFNITNAEDLETFHQKYSGPDQPSAFWGKALAGFDNKAIRGWAARLDVGTFVASSGRVYPKALKAAPLLRRWIQRLKEQGVTFHVNHRLADLRKDLTATFDTPEGQVSIKADAIILAMGGGSWPQTGSDGRWTQLLKNLSIELSPLQSANCGWEVDCPSEMIPAIEAQPLKNLTASAGKEDAIGEVMLTSYGIEGGPVYQLGPALKAMQQPAITLDLKPTFTRERLVAKMESAKKNFLSEARVRWKLSEAASALLEHFHGPFHSTDTLATATKACTVPFSRPRPIAEAISSSGGIKWTELTDGLMIQKIPGLFAAGEMIDWEAPTGGYLMQGCFASGSLAAQTAVDFLENQLS